MNIPQLVELGLTEAQAKAYSAVVELNPVTPPNLALYIKETRTNCYKILEQLELLNLAERDETGKKIRYWAKSPTAFADITKSELAKAEQKQKHLQHAMPSLLEEYVKHTGQPSVKYYQGVEGLRTIYLSQVTQKQDIYIIRPNYNLDALDFDQLSDIRRMARDAKIKRYEITPDRPLAPKNYQISDPFMLLTRTWMKEADYSAPVEWNVYGDSVAIMSFGKELVGIIIESPQVAESLRQLYRLLDEGLRRRPDYDNLPKHAKFIADTPTSKAHPLSKKQRDSLAVMP